MTKEDKQLLLRDLCARLPYRVHMHTNSTDNIELLDIVRDIDYEDQYWINGYYYVEDVRPYLRPMSSMTEEECDMVEEILGDKCIFDFMSNGDIVLKQGQFSQNKLAKLYDYYTSIHIDYRGLIPKGLALKAPEGMYKIN